jgi:probable phosphoglycerate mutase
MIGRSDPPLGPEAALAAEAVKEALAGAAFGRCCSSPLRRAVQTAALLTPLKPELVEAFREIDLGAWEGLTGAEAKERNPDLWEARGADPAGVAPPGGESLIGLSQRVWPAWEAIAEGPGRLVLVVAHRAVNQVILAKIRGLDLSEAMAIEQPYGALTRILYSKGAFEIP